MPITAIALSSLCDMACSLTLLPPASLACWRGSSTAGPSHKGAVAEPKSRNEACQLSQAKRHRQSRRFDDLLARGGQPGQRQNRSRFARRRVQRRFLEPEVKLATAAVAWERRGGGGCFPPVRRAAAVDI